MKEMSDQNWRQLGDAVVLWSGKGRSAYPRPSDDRVIGRFGEALGAQLLVQVREIVDVFYSSRAAEVAKDLREMGEIAIHDFAGKYPRLPVDAVEALAWCYTFDFK